MNSLAINTAPSPQPNSRRTRSEVKEKGRPDVRWVKDWRVQWKQVLSVSAFKGPSTKIQNPVVTRALWVVVVAEVGAPHPVRRPGRPRTITPFYLRLDLCFLLFPCLRVQRSRKVVSPSIVFRKS